MQMNKNEGNEQKEIRNLTLSYSYCQQVMRHEISSTAQITKLITEHFITATLSEPKHLNMNGISVLQR